MNPIADAVEYLKQFSPSIGPVKCISSSLFFGDDYQLSTMVFEGMSGTDTPVKKQWKVYYNAAALTHSEIAQTEWL